MNATVLVKGWPGPVNTPISSLGPSLPASCPTPAGDSHAARGAVAAAWFEPALALYLLVAEPTVWWSYTWWYDIHDGVCESPHSSAFTTLCPMCVFPFLLRAYRPEPLGCERELGASGMVPGPGSTTGCPARPGCAGGWRIGLALRAGLCARQRVHRPGQLLVWGHPVGAVGKLAS